MREPRYNPHPRVALLVPVCIVLLFVNVAGSLTFQEKVKPSSREATFSPQERAHIRHAVAAVGLILVRGQGDDASAPPQPRGSGVIVRSDGIVATNHHVITETRSNLLFRDIFLSLSSDGEARPSESNSYRLKPLILDKTRDLALLRMEPESSDESAPAMTFPTVEIGNSDALEVLDDLVIIGFPEKGGVTVTVNRGVVEGKDLLQQWIKTDARVIHGNSGGAAVDLSGRLVGIPTRVVPDRKPVDRDGDGFPDDYIHYGAVGFLRPASLIKQMLARLDAEPMQASSGPVQTIESPTLVAVNGVVISSGRRLPVAGALVGLYSADQTAVTEKNLLTWGSTKPDGKFTLNNRVPPGRYNLRVKALGFEALTTQVEVSASGRAVVVELTSTGRR